VGCRAVFEGKVCCHGRGALVGGARRRRMGAISRRKVSTPPQHWQVKGLGSASWGGGFADSQARVLLLGFLDSSHPYFAACTMADSSLVSGSCSSQVISEEVSNKACMVTSHASLFAMHSVITSLTPRLRQHPHVGCYH
jgi:hypothetical protein